LLAEVAGKRLELLLELMPAATLIAYLRNPTNPVFAETETKEVQVAARALGVRLLFVNASRPSEIETAFADIDQQRAGALLMSSDGFLLTRPDQIVALAARHAVPALYPCSVTEGGMFTTSQCQNPLPVGASGSKQVIAKLLVPAGAPDQARCGDLLPPSQPKP
jgi:putative tryptophan/tyrosine transport system substrate-binding protein